MKRTAPPNLLVVFGASGDLAKRKLLPALFDLDGQGLLHPDFTVLGYARTAMTDDEFRAQTVAALREHTDHERNGAFDAQRATAFAQRLYYQTGAYDDLESFRTLAERIHGLDQARATLENHLFYLATPPNVFMPISSLLKEVGLAQSANGGWTRIIIEKPFGHD
ncbi:MAG: glucose-6-phosphate dehydrogenase, partial [Caldilineaceae bacterium]|nr:glucose-6-phosphate dehydrogenase [Caldilineaceae bacterium]